MKICIYVLFVSRLKEKDAKWMKPFFSISSGVFRYIELSSQIKCVSNRPKFIFAKVNI